MMSLTIPSRSARRSVRPAVVVATLLGLVGLYAISACGSTGAAGSASGDPAAGQESAEAAKAQSATAIDVRTPEEHADGHIKESELINFQSAEFGQQSAALNPSTTYVVYCRSGNRSAQAATQMQAAGLTVLDGGSLENMVAAGWPAA